jgi:hypothetical protein
MWEVKARGSKLVAGPGQEVRDSVRKITKAKGLKGCASGRVFAYQVQGPKFNSQFHQKKEKKTLSKLNFIILVTGGTIDFEGSKNYNMLLSTT